MADLLATVGGDATASKRAKVMVDWERFGLDESKGQMLTEQAVDFAVSNGLMINATTSTDQLSYTHAPFSLLPVKYSKKEFERGMELSKIYSKLVDRVSRDTEWLRNTLSSVLDEDEFTKRLMDVFEDVLNDGIVQKAYLGVFRSDYMLHEPTGGEKQAPRLQQVELNTIASSFGTLSSVVYDLHKFLLARYETEIPAIKEYFGSPTSYSGALPDSPSNVEIPNGLAKAFKHYGKSDAIVLFIVQPGERNVIDQRGLEYVLWSEHKIRVVRKSLCEVEEQGKIGVDHTLVLPEGEVAVAYFRAGYTPDDYPSSAEWAGRTKLEKSKSICCPSIAYHLVGAKKVQQALAGPEVLERFLNKEECAALRESFAGLYGLERGLKSTEEIVAKAIEHPELYVMKPQREGGGNNFYGNDVREQLKTMTEKQREAYILMTKIEPKKENALLVRNGEVLTGPAISELGMYSVALFDDGEEIVNHHAGHLLRTKLANVNEGGVASGFAVLSSPFLQ